MNDWLMCVADSPYLLAAITSILTVEVILATQWSALVCRLLEGIKRTLVSLYDPDLNEEQREISLRRAALTMLAVSFKALFLLMMMIFSFWGDELLLFLLREYFASESLKSQFTSSHTGMLLVYKSTISIVYYFLRLKIKSSRDAKELQSKALKHSESEESYSEISKALHRFALEGNLISRLSFERGRRGYLRNSVVNATQQEPIWVCGLARAGTTILTDLLYETGAFASLTYRHMPFPLAPHQWRKLSRFGIGGTENEVERAHGDGMMVSINSPEALEEVFWRLHEPEVYQNSESLKSHIPTIKTLNALSDYIELVMLDASSRNHPQQKLRFLSKNNNHLMRLESLLGHFPKAKLIVPIRDPFEHAESLRSQHLRWRERHARDPFSRDYMDWLAHHEFGSGHIKFSFEKDQANDLKSLDGVSGHDPTQELSYWTDRWYEAYHRVRDILLGTMGSRVILIDYDELSAQPRETLRLLAEHLNLALSHEQIEHMASRFRGAPKRADQGLVDPMMRDRLHSLYTELKTFTITP